MIVAAIDPGLNGAIVVVDLKSNRAWKEKLKYDRNGFLINRLQDKFSKVDKVLIEKIHGRGGRSAKSTFSMGYYFGQIVHELIQTGRTIEFVLPTVWTKVLHKDLDVIKREEAKQRSLRAYHMYFPHDPIGKTKGKDGYHDGLIDTLLIASYELLKDNKRLPRWQFEDLEMF